MSRTLRAVRVGATAAASAAAVTLAVAAGPALAAATPNESETVTCGAGCFDVVASAATAGGNATFTASDNTLNEAFTISGEPAPQDATLALTIGAASTTPSVTCTDSAGVTTGPSAAPITLSNATFPVTCDASYPAATADLASGYVDAHFGITSDTDTSATTTGTYAVYETGHVPAVAVAQSDTISGPSSGNRYAAAGETIDYTATVTNSGQAPVRSASVADSNASITFACPSGTLDVGDSENCTGSDTVTQNDVDGGPIDSSATASATPTGSGVPVDSSADDLSLSASQQPAARLTQTPQVAGFTAASRPITYAENVTNTGNVTLFSPSIANTLTGVLPLQCDRSVLAPGASASCTETYVTGPADVAAGSVANTATMTLATPDSTVTSNPSSSSVPFTGAAAVTGTTYTAPTPPRHAPADHTHKKKAKKKKKKKSHHRHRASKKHHHPKHHRRRRAR